MSTSSIPSWWAHAKNRRPNSKPHYKLFMAVETNIHVSKCRGFKEGDLAAEYGGTYAMFIPADQVTAEQLNEKKSWSVPAQLHCSCGAIEKNTIVKWQKFDQ